MQTQQIQTEADTQNNQPKDKPFWTVPQNLRTNLFSGHGEPQFGQRKLNSSTRQAFRRQLGLEGGTGKIDSRNHAIPPQAAWYDKCKIADPGLIYAWAMLMLNPKESVCGFIPDPNPKRGKVPVRYGFRLTRHTEFVEGMYWDENDLMVIRPGIIDCYRFPLYATIYGVDLDTPPDRDANGYLDIDHQAHRSYMLTYRGEDVEECCGWEELTLENDFQNEFPAVHVGTLLNDDMFRLPWNERANTIAHKLGDAIPADQLQVMLDNAEREISEQTGTQSHSVFGASFRVGRDDRSKFWPRVHRVAHERDLPSEYGFGVANSLKVICKGHLQCWALAEAYHKDFWDTLEALKGEPEKLIEVSRDRYIKLILDVRAALHLD